ncbi:MAG: hypothetical protein ACK56I_17545, partial [bacterium]
MGGVGGKKRRLQQPEVGGLPRPAAMQRRVPQQVVERTAHPGHVPAGGDLGPPVGERPPRLPLEVDDGRRVGGIEEHLAEVVVAVDPDQAQVCRACGEAFQAAGERPLPRGEPKQPAAERLGMAIGLRAGQPGDRGQPGDHARG